MNWVINWPTKALCRNVEPDRLFAQGAAQNRAKLICVSCPVRSECLADALDNEIEFGVWGGMTERERRALLRRRPDVPSWRELLYQARRLHGQVPAVAIAAVPTVAAETTIRLPDTAPVHPLRTSKRVSNPQRATQIPA